MNYIEKLFKQYPFIYKIGDNYYAFGIGVCSAIASGRFPLIDNRYNEYLELCYKKGEPLEARIAFCKLKNIAEIVKEKVGVDFHSMDTFHDMGFDEEAIEEVKAQIDRYIAFFRKYHLQDYLD